MKVILLNSFTTGIKSEEIPEIIRKAIHFNNFRLLFVTKDNLQK